MPELMQARDLSLAIRQIICIIAHMSYKVGDALIRILKSIENQKNTQMKTFKYRLQPSKSQRKKLIETLELCRWVYNETLAIRKNTWEQEGKTLSLYDTNKLLTFWKQEHPELKGVFSQVLQNVQERVDLAFKAFFRRVKSGEKPGYPRFRGYGWYDSFTFKQFGFELLDTGLLLSKIGVVKIILHRPIKGRIKTLTIQRDAVGNWYACFACEVEIEPLLFNNLAIGIDVGLENFATLSNGVRVKIHSSLEEMKKNLVEHSVSSRRWMPGQVWIEKHLNE